MLLLPFVLLLLLWPLTPLLLSSLLPRSWPWAPVATVSAMLMSMAMSTLVSSVPTEPDEDEAEEEVDEVVGVFSLSAG